MIRHFTALGKSKFEKLSDETIFNNETEGFRLKCGKCPCSCCGAVGRLSYFSFYYRHLVSYGDGGVIEGCVCVIRFKCSSCKTTHALLPDIVTPYSPYSLRFKITVLIAYITRNKRKMTVEKVCNHYGIAISTLYEWKKLLSKHKDLLLGELMSRKKPPLAFLENLLESESLSDLLCGFFSRFGFSFMQNRPTVTTRTRPP